MEIVAHRGASAERPEHTLAAYELAVRQGATGVECDVRLTRDGHLVCVHDRTVNRTSNGHGALSELRLADLEPLDFGDGNGVLTLARLLEFTTSTGTRLFVETKHPVRYGGLVEAKLTATLARFGLTTPGDRDTSPVVVMSFAATAMRRISLATPRLPTVLLLDAVTARRPLPRWVDVAGPDVAVVRADPGYGERTGRPVYCWTVDDPADIAACAAAGVRYLATNTPATARDVLSGGTCGGPSSASCPG